MTTACLLQGMEKHFSHTSMLKMQIAKLMLTSRHSFASSNLSAVDTHPLPGLLIYL